MIPSDESPGKTPERVQSWRRRRRSRCSLISTHYLTCVDCVLSMSSSAWNSLPDEPRWHFWWL